MMPAERAALGWCRSAARWALTMLEEKRDGYRRLSMTRLAVAFFTGAEVYRLVSREPIGWPDAALAFCILFALPLGKALDRAAPDAVVQAVAGIFGRGDALTPAAQRLGGPTPGYERPADVTTDAEPSFPREDDEP